MSAVARDGRLGVGIIGAGKVGPIIGAALAGAGHALTGITSGSDNDRVSSILPGVPVLEPLEVVRRSQLVVIAVPRAELAGLVSGIAELGGWQMGQLVLHTDPAHGVDVLAPATATGAIGLAVHPAINFTGTSMDLRQLQAGYAGVTASAPFLPIAQALAVELGCEPVIIAEAARVRYAEALDTVTSFSRSIVQQATGMLREMGIDNPGGYLSAVVQSAVEQALREASDPPPLI